MKTRTIQLLPTVVAACITLTFFMTPTYGSSIVIGGNYTDIGTIIFVSPKPGDTPATTGTALLNIINGITDNSATNPYLIKLGPGIYDLGTSTLQMKEYVDLEGAGEGTTTISGETSFSNEGVVQGASNSEIRFLTVQSTGAGLYATGILNWTSTSPKITNVTVSVSQTGNNTPRGVFNYTASSATITNVTVLVSGGGQCYGVYNYYTAGVKMNNVSISVSGGTYGHGVYNYGGEVRMNNVTVSASGVTTSRGVDTCCTGTAWINHSAIKASTHTVENGTSAVTYVANTQLDGGSVSNSGTLTCVGAYDENYVALGTNCQ